ncbi:MAG: hypothetical protein CMN30_28055 [Sandaracinus sp.]|nr:hypothetical protein [Sandaracinus sp.]
MRAPLQAALKREMHALDLFAVRAWLASSALGAGLGAFIAATASMELGLAGCAVAGPYALWFAFVHQRLLAGPISPGLDLVNSVIEGSLTWVLFLVILFVQGAPYALASWVPPMFFALTVFGLTLRMRARAAVITGVVGAVVFLGAHLLLARPRMPAELADLVIFGMGVQLSRTFTLVALGVLAAMAVGSLRRAIGRAEVSAREHDLFGKYRLVREIAKGGMAAVFEAQYCPEGGFERKVAIKRIHPHLAEQEKFVDFFRSEAAISSRLSHPNIVVVLDFGRVDGKYFLSMEYVDGATLHALTREDPEPLPVGVVAAIGMEMLAGLQHAHQGALGADGRPLHVVHRDLCPQNVLVSTNGEVKISDFEVARALRDSGTDQTNTVVGHLAYISPEQASGEAVDMRSDLFALGVILWELLAGRSLFRRDNDAATLAALMYDPIPDLGRATVDPAWDVFLGKSLARDPARRFPDAGRMAAALAELPGADDPAALGALAQRVRAHVARVRPEAPLGDDAETRVEPKLPTGRHHALTLE